MTRNLNWEDLKYFNAVAQTLSIRQAAEIHKISAATLSRRVVNLEERLGDCLFVRKANRLSLTPLGRDILLQVEQVHSSVRNIETRCGVGDSQHKIRIRTPNSYTRWHILPLIHEATVRDENITFVINCDSENAAGEHEADDLLVSHHPQSDPAFSCRELNPTRLGLFRSRGSKRDNALVLWRESGSEAEFVNAKLREILPNARGVVVMDGAEAYLEAVAEGLGIGMICAEAVSRFPARDQLEALPYQLNRQLWLCRRKDARPVAVMNRLEKQIFERDAQSVVALQM
ncbi:LysR family transcriptional regulator [Maritalea sp.]|uniref:LysR family transcriptional regulator n=1 Tax=Maritalea sp. TaxID=2003361 RepID=UPI003EFB2954